MMRFLLNSASPWRIKAQKTTIMTLFVVFKAFCLCHSSHVFGDFDLAHPPHNFFNAHLLKPGESQISVIGNFKSGVTNQLELGIQSLGYVTSPVNWNFSIKHEMFTMANFKTSFNSHSIFFQKDSEHFLLSLHGVITSIFLMPNHGLNLGLMDGLAMKFSKDSESSLHMLTPLLGYDLVLSKLWAFSVLMLRPLYASEQDESRRFGQGQHNIDFTNSNTNPSFGMATATVSWSKVNLEFGFIYFSYAKTIALPYANLFWRFHG